MSKLSGIKAYFKGLSKRQKVIWIVAVVLLLLLIAGGIAAAVLLTRKDESLPGVLKRKDYYYAIRATDEDGFRLSDDFIAGLQLDDFVKTTLSEAEGVTLSEELLLTSYGATPGEKAEYSFTYKGLEIASITVEVVSNDAIAVSDAVSLGNIANGTGTYILTSDIDLTPVTAQISNFSGRLFGNHFTLTGSLPAGGLFKRISDAEVRGLEFSVNSEMNYSAANFPSDGLNIGVLASRTDDSDISECYVKGSIAVNYSAPTNNSVIRIGGLVGFAKAGARSNLNTPVYSLMRCGSEAALTVRGNGVVYIGGIYGRAENIGAENLRCYGEISFEGSASALKELYAGGIGGYHGKEYGAALQTGHELESTNRIYFYGTLRLNVPGDSGNAYAIKAGGIFGAAERLSMTNSEFRGVIEITSAAPLHSGGITGEASCDLNAVMRINGVRSVGKMTLNATGICYGGGVVGVMTGNAEYLNVAESILPELTGESDKTRVVDRGAALKEQ